MVGKLERSTAYLWLRKNSLYMYLLQAPGLYLIFGIIYPVAGSSPLFCYAVLFVLTTLVDAILTYIYVSMKEKIIHRATAIHFKEK